MSRRSLSYFFCSQLIYDLHSQKYDSKLFWSHVDKYLMTPPSFPGTGSSSSADFKAPGSLRALKAMSNYPVRKKSSSSGMMPPLPHSSRPIDTVIPTPVDSMSDMSPSSSSKPLRSIQQMNKGWTPSSGENLQVYR
jgi:hypothetical protein